MGQTETKYKVVGTADVEEVIVTTRAGIAVTSGVVKSGYAQVVRDGKVIHGPARTQSIRRFKDPVKEVRTGQRAGIKIFGYEEQEGDRIEMLEVDEEGVQ